MAELSRTAVRLARIHGCDGIGEATASSRRVRSRLCAARVSSGDEDIWGCESIDGMLLYTRRGIVPALNLPLLYFGYYLGLMVLLLPGIKKW